MSRKFSLVMVILVALALLSACVPAAPAPAAQPAAQEPAAQAPAPGSKGEIVFIPKSTSATFYLFLVKGAQDKAKESDDTGKPVGPCAVSRMPLVARKLRPAA